MFHPAACAQLRIIRRLHSICVLQDLSWLGAPATLCVSVQLCSHFPEQAEPAVEPAATAKSPYPGTYLFIYSLVMSAVFKATLATGFGYLFP